MTREELDREIFDKAVEDEDIGLTIEQFEEAHDIYTAWAERHPAATDDERRSAAIHAAQLATDAWKSDTASATDFRNVQCYYTGGGVWVYSAKYKGVWLYGSLDQVLWTYTISGEDIEENHGCDYEAFATEPDEYPTWGDIARSLLDNLAEDPCLSEIIATLTRYNPDLTKRVCDYT